VERSFNADEPMKAIGETTKRQVQTLALTSLIECNVDG